MLLPGRAAVAMRSNSTSSLTGETIGREIVVNPCIIELLSIVNNTKYRSMYTDNNPHKSLGWIIGKLSAFLSNLIDILHSKFYRYIN